MVRQNENTTELLAGAKQGDEDAVNSLLDKQRNALRRQVQMRLDRKVRRRVGVSDIVQEVLIEASRRLDSYLADPKMPFQLWMRHMAQDRIVDAHRRHRATIKRSVDREQPLLSPANSDRSSMEMAPDLIDPTITPVAAATMKEMARRVELAMDELDERDRQILVLRHFDHLTNKEVAKALNVSEPAASMRYLRAVRRLRDLLEDSAPEDN